MPELQPLLKVYGAVNNPWGHVLNAMNSNSNCFRDQSMVITEYGEYDDVPKKEDPSHLYFHVSICLPPYFKTSLLTYLFFYKIINKRYINE